MTKIVQILFIALLAVALCNAAAPRSRLSRLQARRNRLARQEAADEAAVTPYPFADELKPEVPFDETATAEEPQPNQPDEVYGPPQEEAAIETDSLTGVEEEKAVEEESSDAEEQKHVIAEGASTPARLTSRRASSLRKSSVRPAKLRKAVPAHLQLKPQFAPQPVFYYVAQ